MKKLLVILPILFFLITPLAKAEDIWTMAQSEQYGKKAGGMFGRGLLNIATCFVDVIVSTVEGTKKGPPVIGTISGLGSGIGCTAIRALSGALDVTTFWVPGFNGFPVCKSYANCISCESATEEVTAAPAYQPPAPAIVQGEEPVQQASPLKYVKK